MLNGIVKLVWPLALIVVWPYAAAHAESLVLRERATVNGPVIRLGDVADISAESAKVMKDLVTTPLFPTPAPGTQHFLQRSQVLDLLTARGIETENIRIQGAEVVEIGALVTKKAEARVTTAKVANPKPLTEVKELVETTIADYMAKHSNHVLWSVEVNLENAELEEIGSWGKQNSSRWAKSTSNGKPTFSTRCRG